MKPVKKFWFDVETTGLHSHKDSIHQLAIMIEIDGKIVETAEIKMRPYHFEELPDDYVTPVGGITKEMMKSYGTQSEGFKALKKLMGKYVNQYEKTDKFTAAGYNCQGFDMQFLRVFFEKNGDTYFGSWFWPATIDVMILAAYFLQKERSTMPNFKLESVAKYLGLEVEGEGFHDALSDIKITKEVLEVLEMR